MSARRVVLNPLFLHRRSRLLWLWYVVVAAAASAALWWRLDALAAANGGLSPGLFFRPWFRAALVVVTGLAAAAVTATSVAGPVGRIEDWLDLRRAGGRTRPLRVRTGDAFETLIRLLNEMHLRAQSGPAPASPRKRRMEKPAVPGAPARRRASRPRVDTPAPPPPRSASTPNG